MSNQRMCWQGQNKGIQSKACKLEPSLSNSISSNQTSHKYFEPSKGKFSSLFGMWFANWTKKKKWKGLIGLNWPVEIGFTINNAHHQFGTTLCVYIKIPGLKHVPSTKACFCAHYRIKCYPIGILENSLKLVFLFFSSFHQLIYNHVSIDIRIPINYAMKQVQSPKFIKCQNHVVNRTYLLLLIKK